MSKIYFDYKDLNNVILVVLVTALFGISFFQVSVNSVYFIILGVLALLFYNVKHLCFKNYIRLRKTTIYIKLNRKKGFKIERQIIKGHKFLYNTLIINTIHNDCYVFNTKDICKKDLERTNNILTVLTLNDVNEVFSGKEKRI